MEGDEDLTMGGLAVLDIAARFHLGSVFRYSLSLRSTQINHCRKEVGEIWNFDDLIYAAESNELSVRRSLHLNDATYLPQRDNCRTTSNRRRSPTLCETEISLTTCLSL